MYAVCRLLITGLASLAMGAALAQGNVNYPPAARKPVTDTYHGTTVTDDYRWLEDTKSPDVVDWTAKQNALTRSRLDALPDRARIFDELTALQGQAPISRRSLRYAGGRLFALKSQPPVNQPRLVVMSNPSDPSSEKTLIDPNVLNPKGTTTIDWYVPSLDGKTVAVSLSDNGSEDGTLRFVDTVNGRMLPDVVPRVQYATAGGSVAWLPGNRGVYYTRYPQGRERSPDDVNFYQQVWFHQLGAPASADTYVIGRDWPRIAETRLSSTRDGRYTLAAVSNGDGGEHAFYLKGPTGGWRQISGFDDGVRDIVLGPDGRWYGVVLKDSPRGRVVSAKLTDPALARAATVIAESVQVIDSVVATRSRLYVEMLVGGPQELHAFTLKGEPIGRIGDTPVATAYVGAVLEGDDIVLGRQSFIEPFAWYRYTPTLEQPRPQPVMTRLTEQRSDLTLDDLEVRREFATSKDGTRVPVSIVMKKGTVLDGSHPLLLTAYGGYSISLNPRFSLDTLFWVRHGGIHVTANLRGGSEYGEAWHQAGALTRKQNVFDDFIASAEYLIAQGFTSRERLAIEGGSNGGLLMGAVTVQRPELFRAVVSHVGIYDMLRVELSPNGAFNVTEFGSVKDPAQFKALYDYSPYHHVVDKTHYPAMMLLTGLHDGRVEPHNSLKMAARLQAASTSGRPVLLRVAGDAGHGMGMSLGSAIAQEADVMAFLFDQLGMK